LANLSKLPRQITIRGKNGKTGFAPNQTPHALSGETHSTIIPEGQIVMGKGEKKKPLAASARKLHLKRRRTDYRALDKRKIVKIRWVGIWL